MKTLLFTALQLLFIDVALSQPDVLYPPEYSGGKEALKSFIAENLNYPAKALENQREAKIYLLLDIDKEGKVTEIRPNARFGYGFDEEALRLVKQMPAFEPATKNGAKVAGVYQLVIAFVLPKKRINKEKIRPEYPGGKEAMKKFVEENLQYPEEEKGNGKSGAVVVQLTIDEEGQIAGQRYVQTLGQPFNEEVKRLLALMPPFESGKIGNKPATMFYTAAFPFTDSIKMAKDSLRLQKIDSLRVGIKYERRKALPVILEVTQVDTDSHKGDDFVAASFPGGKEAMKLYFAEQLKYPKKAQKKQKEGVVTIRFIVTKKGKVKKPEVITSRGYGMDDETIRLVKSMPIWEPATKANERVEDIIVLAVPFILEEK